MSAPPSPPAATPDEPPPPDAGLDATATAAATTGPAWPWWSAFVALVGALAVTLLVSVVALGVLSAVGINVSHPSRGGVAIFLTYLQDAAFVVAAVLTALLLTGRPRARDFGVRVPQVGPALGWALGAAVFYVGFFLTFQAIAHPHAGDSIFKQLDIAKASPSVVSLTVLVCVVAPLAEETLFRGYMWTALRRSAGPWGATILVGLLFGLVHVFGTPALLLIPLAMLGAVLCVVRWRTESIMPTVALHVLNNCAALAQLQGWTWQAIPLGAAALALALGVLTAISKWSRP